MVDPNARGGVRRYLDTVKPEEYVPNTGEVDLSELSLTGLADLYGSDKGSIKHNYTAVYEKLIDDLRGATPRRQLKIHVGEAGIACGASLRMWCNYLPSSKIWGYDIRPECAGLCADQKNLEIRIQDPARIDLGHAEPRFDLFVDDASHISERTVDMFRNIWPRIIPGGYYVIEDLACTYSEAYTEQFRRHFDRGAINDRGAILRLMDEIMRATDTKESNISEMHYYPQLLVVVKKK